MSNDDFQVAHLTDEQMQQLKHFESQLGVTLIAYEQKHASEAFDINASPEHD